MSRRASPIGLRLERPDRTRGGALYLQVANKVEEAIRAGRIRIGQRLPSERALGMLLAISRTTATSAYAELRARGVVTAHVGRGTSVVATPAGFEPASIPWSQRVSRVITEAAQICYPASREPATSVSFANGWPDPALCPSDVLRSILAAVAAGDRSAVHGLPALEGEIALRKALAQWLHTVGVSTTPDRILITAGAQEGVGVVARALVTPGDVVITESPTWLGAILAFRSAGAEVVGVPLDGQGLRCDVLEEMLRRHRPKLIYVIPTFHNPTGSVLSVERRLRLLALAARFRVPILESDLYSQIFFDGNVPPSLEQLDESGLVIYQGSLTKMVAPGLRIGWLVVPRDAMPALVTAKMLASLATATIPQLVAAEFLRGGHLERHLPAMREHCRVRRDRLVDVLRARCPQLRFRTPSGGYYLWAKLPSDVSSVDVETEARRRGVTIRAGWQFAPDARENQHVRLCFAAVDAGMMEHGGAVLAEAIDDATVRRGDGSSRRTDRAMSIV